MGRHKCLAWKPKLEDLIHNPVFQRGNIVLVCQSVDFRKPPIAFIGGVIRGRGC